jgi:hypothetical protein
MFVQMLPIVFAMVTLQNPAPDPAASAPAVSVGQRLTGLTGLTQMSPLSSGDTDGLGGLTITAGCTYGTPPLGASLLSDATALSRTFTQPQCSNDALAPAYVNGFAPAYVAWRRTLQPVSSLGPVALGSTTGSTLRPADAEGFTVRATEPAKSYVLQHLSLPKEFSGSVGGSGFTVRTETNAHAPAAPARRLPPPASTH